MMRDSRHLVAHRVALCCVLLLLSVSCAYGAVVYVDAGAPGPAHDGSSWSTAFTSLQQGLDAAFAGDEIWVAEGTYYERITLKAGVALYGGFAGDEVLRESRDWLANETVLDGGGGGRVVTATNLVAGSSTLDGFTIRNGSASGGGGVYCSQASPTLANDMVVGNVSTSTGGGIYCSNSSPWIVGSTVAGNTAATLGGGIYCANSSPVISCSYLRGNTASQGGGMYVTGSSAPTVESSALTGNTATGTYQGGGIYYSTSSGGMVANSAIAGNGAGTGGGIYCSGATPTVVNTIVAFNGAQGIYLASGTPVLRYNCVYGNAAANYGNMTDPTGTDGNISQDPLLVDYATGDIHLQPLSPCVDAGENAAVVSGWLDIDAEPRIQGGGVDIGADECFIPTEYPDLSIIFGPSPGYLRMGDPDPVTLALEVHNWTYVAVGATDIQICLSADAEIGPEDALLATVPCPALGGLAVWNTSIPVTVPTDVPLGYYYLAAVADASDSIAETNEGNNVALHPVSVTNTDLALSALAAARVGGWAGTGPVSVAYTVTNGSRVRSAATTIAIYCSPDAQIDGGDQLLATQACGALESRRSLSGRTEVTLPEGVTSGYIGAMVDPLNTMVESDEDNNVACIALNERVDGDLLPADGTVLPVTLAPGVERAFPVDVPFDATNLFITLRKVNVCWFSVLRLLRDGQVIATQMGGGDLIIHVTQESLAPPAEYVVTVSGSGGTHELSVSTSLPELPLDQWSVGTILHSSGKAWYQVTVGPEVTALNFAVETLGLRSSLQVTRGSLAGPPIWLAQGATMSLTIPSPDAGTYYVTLQDSAYIPEQADQSRDHMIYVSATPTVPPPSLIPVITSISPTTGGTNGPVTITVTGQALDQTAAVLLTREGYSDVSAVSVTGSKDWRILAATFDLSAAEPGQWLMGVATPSATAVAPVPFTVEAGGETKVWAQLSGREQIRAGRLAHYVVKYGNSGNVDAQWAVLYLWLPRHLAWRFLMPDGVYYDYDPSVLAASYDSEPVVVLPILMENLQASECRCIDMFVQPSTTEQWEIGAAIEAIPSYAYSGAESPHSLGFVVSDAPLYDVTLTMWPGYATDQTGATYYDEHGVMQLPIIESGDVVGYIAYTQDESPWTRADYMWQGDPDDIWITMSGEGLKPYSNTRQLTEKEIDAYRRELENLGQWKHGDWWDEDSLESALDLDGWKDFADDPPRGNCNGALEYAAEKAGINNGNGWIPRLQEFWPTSGQRLADSFGIPLPPIPHDWPQRRKNPLLPKIPSVPRPGSKLGPQVTNSSSPEDKYGPSGWDASETAVDERQHWIRADRPLDYRIDFWNKEDAPAATCDVVITDQLSPNLDWSTFRFTEIGFLDWSVPLEPCRYFNIDVTGVNYDLSVYYPGQSQSALVVNVEGTFDPDTGQIEWIFHTMDQATREYPENPYGGFLPPITDSGWEIGWVEYSASPLPGLASGTTVSNQAWVIFDTNPANPAPKLGPWMNTLDTVSPDATMLPLPERTELPAFSVSWEGVDDLAGSGIATCAIYVSQDGETPYLWLEAVAPNSVVFAADFGHTYAFYARGRDHVGNLEPMPGVPDAVTYTACFSDVLSDQWAWQYIYACVRAGIVSGFDDGTYRPTLAVDRGQMAVYISRALAGGDEHVPTGPAIATFTDVATDHWAYKYVEYAYANDIVQGYGAGVYAPDLTVDRAQMAVFVARALVTPTDRPDLPSYTPPETPTFSDVATDQWAYKYIEYIAQDSVAVSQGYDDGTYRPDVIVTRDQMAVYVQRAFDLPM